jgi:23S rRNA (cytosine1962-C5)-methyltransferase
MQWARANAAAAGMESMPIRWIVEDAMKFIQREINRGSKYDILVADPPSYGTGPKKERWKFSQDIASLLTGLASISSSSLRMLLLTCHTPNVGSEDLRQWVADHFELSVSRLEPLELDLSSASGKRLPSGSCVRYFV